MSPPVSSLVSRRLLHLVPVWLGVSLLAFAISSLAPGDPAQMILQRQTGEPPSQEAVERLRRELGLNDPLAKRYVRWLGNAVRGDLGRSYRSDASVVSTLFRSFPATVELAVFGLVLGVIVAVPIGVVAAVHRGSGIDNVARVLALIGTSMPSFVVGYLLILLFAVSLRLFPVAGSDGWRYLVLPVLTLAVGEAAALARLTRASMLDVLDEDYVRTARAKGAPEGIVLMRHALRNALNPVVTLAGVRLGRLLGGVVIVETVFARPGLGRTLVDSIYDRDYPTIQGFILLAGTAFVLANLLVDLSYLWMDPRIRSVEPRRQSA